MDSLYSFSVATFQAQTTNVSNHRPFRHVVMLRLAVVFQCQASIPLYASSRDQDSIKETSGIDGDGDKHKEPEDPFDDILKS